MLVYNLSPVVMQTTQLAIPVESYSLSPRMVMHVKNAQCQLYQAVNLPSSLILSIKM